MPTGSTRSFHEKTQSYGWIMFRNWGSRTSTYPQDGLKHLN